jgi:bifunctional NMN adenylyltransferase/nudix hydrolase
MGIGVIVGRFQVHVLHQSHLHLIELVRERHKQVAIFLGVAPFTGTKRNPLDFYSRKQMLQESFPDVAVVPLPDKQDDYEWSRELDRRILEINVSPGEPTLYGGRDSFIFHYKGRNRTTELDIANSVSGTDVRQMVAQEVRNSADWRAGVIYTTMNLYPHCRSTVDIAAFNYENKVLLARRKAGDKLRFIGGFVDPGESLEQAAAREFREETGCDIGDLKYVCSAPVSDWRLGQQSKGDWGICTSLFAGKYLFGPPKGQDDIAEVDWFDLRLVKPHEMVSEHLKLRDALLKWKGWQRTNDE